MTRPFSIDGLTPSLDVNTADWIVEHVGDFHSGVRALVPPVFESYARVFHPPADVDGRDVRWSDVAKANKHTFHATVSWDEILPPADLLVNHAQPGIWEGAPEGGSLPVTQAARLATLLASFTTTPEHCWFAVWDGWAALALPRDATVPRVHLPGRSMLLLSGPLVAAAVSLEPPPWDQRANLWWPEDRAWCLATDVDCASTYIGGGASCIDAIVRDEVLEAAIVDVDDPVS